MGHLNEAGRGVRASGTARTAQNGGGGPKKSVPGWSRVGLRLRPPHFLQRSPRSYLGELRTGRSLAQRGQTPRNRSVGFAKRFAHSPSPHEESCEPTRGRDFRLRHRRALPPRLRFCLRVDVAVALQPLLMGLRHTLDTPEHRRPIRERRVSQRQFSERERIANAQCFVLVRTTRRGEKGHPYDRDGQYPHGCGCGFMKAPSRARRSSDWARERSDHRSRGHRRPRTAISDSPQASASVARACP